MKVGYMKYRSYRGPHASEPAAVHIAFHLADLATELTSKQRRDAETSLKVWKLKAQVEAQRSQEQAK